jgi:Sec-independent protein translocase protein TatA
MISLMFFLLVLGPVVFGPKKTIQMAQAAANALEEVKEAAGQLKTQIQEPHPEQIDKR